MNSFDEEIKRQKEESLIRLRSLSDSHYPMLLMTSYCGPVLPWEHACSQMMKLRNVQTGYHAKSA